MHYIGAIMMAIVFFDPRMPSNLLFLKEFQYHPRLAY